MRICGKVSDKKISLFGLIQKVFLCVIALWQSYIVILSTHPKPPVDVKSKQNLNEICELSAALILTL